MAKINYQILYVHPYTSLPFQSIIPISIPALIKRIKFPVKGYYASELKKEFIKQAKIIIIDIHWYASLKGAHALLKKIKKINPKIIVIAGGLTATIYAHILVKEMDIDFIIRGDAEFPLPELIKALMGKRIDLTGIPNLVGKGGLETNWSYALSKKDIDKNEYFDIDFFPTLKKDIQRMHNRHPEWPLPVYPFLLPFRGCQKNCLNCMGSLKDQKKYFCRSSITRSAKRVSQDLIKLNKNRFIKYVNIYLDFLTQKPFDFVKKVLPRPLKLNIFYEFASLPEEQVLEYMLNHFKGGVIYFSVDENHSTSIKITDIKKLIRLIKLVQQNKNYTPILYWSSKYARKYAHYHRAVQTVIEQTNCCLSDASYFWIDAPSYDADRNANRKQYLYYYKMSSGYYLLIHNLSMQIIYYLGFIVPGIWIKRLRIILCKLLYNLPFKFETFVRKYLKT